MYHRKGAQEPPGETPGERDSLWESNASISLASWQDWEKIAERERSRRLRQQVDGIFREELMGALALLLVPLLLVLDFASLPPSLYSLLTILDIAIWVFFILEYVCRLAVAEDRRVFVLSAWNLVYLGILLVPALALAAGMGYGIARYFRILRGMQAIQVLFFAGKMARRLSDRPQPPVAPSPAPLLQMRAFPLTSQKPPLPEWSPVASGSREGPITCQGFWLDFSRWGPSDLPAMADITGFPLYVLEEKLRERAYPRADGIGTWNTVFLKIPYIQRDPADTLAWKFYWHGFLAIYDEDGIMTFSRVTLPVIDSLPAIADAEGIPLTGPGIVYLLVRDTLNVAEDLIIRAEEQMVYLEALPLDRLPPNYLTMMYTDQKELSRIISWLLHTKNALSAISDPSSGDDRGETVRIRALVDRCSSLSDTAQNVSDSFGRMVDYYLNTTSYQLNQIMRILAVLTALTLVPTLIGGLLGMNLLGNPWPATLFQMVTVVFLLMLIMAWVYFNFGWLKR